MVLTNAVAGREVEFNSWYDDRHLADILRLPGLVSAQRFELSDVQSAATPYRYLALYEIETDDLAATVAALRALEATEAMPISPALDPGLLASFFRPLGGKVCR